MQLEVINKEIMKDHADRYVEIIDVTYKSLQIVLINFSDQFSVIIAQIIFKNSAKVHWVFRITLRRVTEKRDADFDIYN